MKSKVVRDVDVFKILFIEIDYVLRVLVVFEFSYSWFLLLHIQASLAGQTLTPGRESGQTRMLTSVCTVSKTNNGYDNQVLLNRTANCLLTH